MQRRKLYRIKQHIAREWVPHFPARPANNQESPRFVSLLLSLCNALAHQKERNWLRNYYLLNYIYLLKLIKGFPTTKANDRPSFERAWNPSNKIEKVLVSTCCLHTNRVCPVDNNWKAQANQQVSIESWSDRQVIVNHRLSIANRIISFCFYSAIDSRIIGLETKFQIEIDFPGQRHRTPCPFTCIFNWSGIKKRRSSSAREDPAWKPTRIADVWETGRETNTRDSFISFSRFFFVYKIEKVAGRHRQQPFSVLCFLSFCFFQHLKNKKESTPRYSSPRELR